MYRLVTLLILAIVVTPARAQTVNALYLDGTGAFVALPSDLLHPLNAATVETWVKWERIARWSRVFDFGREGNAAVVQSEKSSHTLNFAIYDRDSDRHRIQLSNGIPVGQWFHIAVTAGPGGMAVYINGELKGTDDYEGGLDVVAGGNNFIGRSNWASDEAFCGYIAEFRIWNYRRSPEEIARAYTRRLTGSEPGLVACWHFDSAPGEQAPNAVSNGQPAQMEQGARIVPVAPMAKYMIPGELEKDAQQAIQTADGDMAKDDPIGAYRHYRAALDLLPGSDKARQGVMQAIERGRFRAALLPVRAQSPQTHPETAFEAAQIELLRTRPPYVDWLDGATTELLAYSASPSPSGDESALIESAKQWHLRLIVLCDITGCRIDKSAPERQRREAVLVKPVSGATPDTLRQEWRQNESYYLISQNITATCDGTVRIIDVQTGKTLTQTPLSARESDRIDYADYRGDAHDLWLKKRNRYVRLIGEENRFDARRDLASENDLRRKVLEDFGQQAAREVQRFLDTY